MPARSRSPTPSVEAKAAEPAASGFGPVSRTSVQCVRLGYREQGLWGPVGSRTTRFGHRHHVVTDSRGRWGRRCS